MKRLLLMLLGSLACVTLVGCDSESTEAMKELTAMSGMVGEALGDIADELPTVVEELNDALGDMESLTDSEEYKDLVKATQRSTEDLKTMKATEYFSKIEPALLKVDSDGDLHYQIPDVDFISDYYTLEISSEGDSGFIGSISVFSKDNYMMLNSYKSAGATLCEDGMSSLYKTEYGDFTFNATLGNVTLQFSSKNEQVLNEVINTVYSTMKENICYVDYSDFVELCD